ncbi:hypothetical protein R80B4_00184 [Fibrobacteres bacterium R8-0-B4]
MASAAFDLLTTTAAADADASKFHLRGIFASYKLVAHSPGHHEGGGTGGSGGVSGGGGDVIHPVSEEGDGEDGGL